MQLKTYLTYENLQERFISIVCCNVDTSIGVIS